MKARRRNLTISLIAILVICCAILTLPALTLAEGDGSGGGSDVPLSLVSSVPADGQKDVFITGEIKLVFSKNVINLAIRDSNKKCFSLSSADGAKVSIEVVMADDQLYPEEKRNISIKLLQKLEPGTAYTLKISPLLQAKNGTSLEHEVTVNFVTAGTGSKPAETTTISDAGQSQINTNQSPTITVDKNTTVSSAANSPTVEMAQTSEVQEQPVVEQSSAAEPVQNKQKTTTTYLVAAGLILLAALGYVYFRKRNGR